MTSGVDDVWRSVAHVAEQRVAVLASALAALHRGAPDAQAQRVAAFDECHKLVGSLDSYGRAGGSALALEAATLLDQPAPDLDALAEVVAGLERVVRA